MSFNPNLPPELQPTREVIARDAELAREAQAILAEVTKQSGTGVRVNTESYNSIQYGADGRAVSRIVNGVQQMTDVEQAVARAQSAARAELDRMQSEIDRLTEQRDHNTGFNHDGSPQFTRSESTRSALDKRITELRLGLVNQKRLNERRWRNEVASDLAQQTDLRALAAELEAKGKVIRARTF